MPRGGRMEIRILPGVQRFSRLVVLSSVSIATTLTANGRSSEIVVLSKFRTLGHNFSIFVIRREESRSWLSFSVIRIAVLNYAIGTDNKMRRQSVASWQAARWQIRVYEFKLDLRWISSLDVSWQVHGTAHLIAVDIIVITQRQGIVITKQVHLCE